MTARSRPGQEAVEAFCEAFSIRTERYRLWYRDRLSVKALQQIEHRAVLLVEQAGRDPDRVVSVDPDKVMIKGTMVNRAEAEAVVHRCFPVCLEVADDVGGIEQSCLLEPTDSALIAVGRQDTTAEPRLMDSDVRLTHDVATLDRVLMRAGSCSSRGPRMAPGVPSSKAARIARLSRWLGSVPR